VVLAGRTFGFHAEDVVVAGMMFLHGLTRAGVASCLKHFPGLGRGTVDSHRERPVVDAHDVDLMVTDVAPFTKLAGIADSVLVGHGAYPGFTGTDVPASASPGILSILRRQVGFARLVFSDDLNMDALSGTLPERAGVAAAAGCDVLVVSHPGEALEEMARAAAGSVADAGLAGRMEDFRERCRPRERAPFSAVEWARLAAEVSSFNEALSRPRGPLPG
jgi:beta-N-acetylhexosaminidase